MVVRHPAGDIQLFPQGICPCHEVHSRFGAGRGEDIACVNELMQKLSLEPSVSGARTEPGFPEPLRLAGAGSTGEELIEQLVT